MYRPTPYITHCNLFYCAFPQELHPGEDQLPLTVPPQPAALASGHAVKGLAFLSADSLLLLGASSTFSADYGFKNGGAGGAEGDDVLQRLQLQRGEEGEVEICAVRLGGYFHSCTLHECYMHAGFAL